MSNAEKRPEPDDLTRAPGLSPVVVWIAAVAMGIALLAFVVMAVLL